jgi:hypothetical protein
MRPRHILAVAGLVAAPALLLGSGNAAQGASSVPVWKASIVDTDTTHGSGEPSIDVAEDGSIYIVAPTGLTAQRGLPAPIGSGGDLVWRSDDNGETWNFLPNTIVGGGDGDVVTGAGDIVYASGLSLACVSLARSADRGATWVNNPVTCSDSPIDDRQWNDEFDGAVFTAFGSIGVDQLNISKSLITDPAVVTSTNVRISSTDHQWPGVMDVDPLEGTVYMAWQTVGSPNDCDSGGCEPEEASTTTPDIIKIAALSATDFTLGPLAMPEHIVVASRPFDTFDAFVGVDVSPQGAVYVVWNERHPEVQETWSMLSVSNDQGDTWSEPTKVNTIATTAFPWVTAGDDGRVMVSYYGTAAKGNSPETVSGDWRVYNAFSDDGGETFGETLVTPNYMHQGAVCTSGTGCAGGTRDLIDFFETEMTPAGCLVITYTDNARDVVEAGVRVTDEAELIAFAKQTDGPSLLANGSCGSAAPAPEPSGEPTQEPTTAPTAQPRPEPLPSTGGSDRLPLLAALVGATAVTAAVRSRTSARRADPNTGR